MTDYVLVQSNWKTVNSISLDLVCDVDIEEEEENLSTNVEKEEQDQNSKQTTLSDENITHITLRSNESDHHEDPILTLNFLQSDKYHLQSIQILSNARHIEFYSHEYLGSCQGSRITELNNDSIYESIFDFNQHLEKLTLKCLKLADITDLIIYCLQISLKKSPQSNSSSVLNTSLPFDLNRVRSMIDETNLSSNARQFMTNLQSIQEHKQAREHSSQQFQLNQMMLMMKGLNTSSFNPTHASPTYSLPTCVENKSSVNEEHERFKQDFVALENRLQGHIDRCFSQLQQHIDKRFDELEEKLSSKMK